jgi:pimeloyl-ACP methyl ester carboxylesterase
MAPVARELSGYIGAIEPIQTATSLDGQVDELARTLEAHATTPAVLVGHSWGAWLSLIAAARRPQVAAKIILVSAGPFDSQYVEDLHRTRLARLSTAEAEEWESAVAALSRESSNRDELLARLGELTQRTDDYDTEPDPHADSDQVAVSGDIYTSVWSRAAEMRETGELLQLAEAVQCPVVAIHGDYDPHPSEGVREPLSRTLPDFELVLLKRCGHTPWLERQAKQAFYRALLLHLGLSDG